MALPEPQIRTNLDDETYQIRLDQLLRNVPGTQSAGLINVRFREACIRLAGGRAAEPPEMQAMLDLTAGLFGGDADAGAPGFAAAMAALRPADSVYLSFREETLLATRLDGERALLLTVSASLTQGFANNLRRSLAEQIGDAGAGAAAGALGALLENANEILLGALVDLRAGSVIDRYERMPGASVVALNAGLIEVMRALFTAAGPPRGLRLRRVDGTAVEIRRAEIAIGGKRLHWARIRFDPDHLLMLAADRGAVPGLLSIMMRSSETETVRIWVDGLLSYGVKSTMSPFPETQSQFLDIVRQLRQLDEDDLLGRLDIGGFANYSIGEGDDQQRCQECIYYLPNIKWCDLPELPVPVEPHWWCRLWKM